jgi:hypothetical protein
MAGYKNALANFKKMKFSAHVELGNDASYAIKGIGSTSFRLESGATLHFEEIMYILGLKKNIISVADLEYKGYWVTFMKKKALLRLEDGEMCSTIVIGFREGGIYKVLGRAIQTLVHSTISPCEMWHRRFGHLHFRVLPSL